MGWANPWPPWSKNAPGFPSVPESRFGDSYNYSETLLLVQRPSVPQNALRFNNADDRDFSHNFQDICLTPILYFS